MNRESIKSYLKTKIGIQRINAIRGSIKIIREKHYKKEHIILNKDLDIDCKTFSLNQFNLFNGYYDLNPLSNDGNYMLVQTARKNANPIKDNSGIGIIRLDTGEYEELTYTKAWCWQQGSRLRWSRKEDNIIFFNDIINSEYCTIKYDIKKKKIVTIMSKAFYDINNNEDYGLSLDFARLQRLRPGYGYGRLRDKTEHERIPKESGIIKVDLKTGTEQLLVSLKKLSTMFDDFDEEGEHYINHISISPKGDKFLFFYIWTTKSRPGWKANLCVMNCDGTELKCLDKKYSVSHYTWLDNDTLLVTGRNAELKLTYRIYSVDSSRGTILDPINLSKDGHPTFINSQSFISDTYPDENYMQKVFLYDKEKHQRIELIDLYADPRLIGEQRCDLHPKVCKKNGETLIFLDSTYKGGKRNIILLKGKSSCLEHCL